MLSAEHGANRHCEQMMQLLLLLIYMDVKISLRPYLPTREGRKAELDDVQKNNSANGCEAATDRQRNFCEIRGPKWEGRPPPTLSVPVHSFSITWP